MKHRLSLMICLVLLVMTIGTSRAGISFDEQVFDFGSVGIEFKLKHSFRFYNDGQDTIRIHKVEAPCNCSSARLLDSTVAPGDTAYFQVTFNTKDLYGPTNKQIKVHTDDSLRPLTYYHYVSVVGQWFNGLRPTPISLFFRPGKATGKVTIPNRGYDLISVAGMIPFDNSFTTSVQKTKARRGELLELEIRPTESGSRGTHHTNLTLHIDTGDGAEVTILTIPIKISHF